MRRPTWPHSFAARLTRKEDARAHSAHIFTSLCRKHQSSRTSTVARVPHFVRPLDVTPRRPDTRSGARRLFTGSTCTAQRLEWRRSRPRISSRWPETTLVGLFSSERTRHRRARSGGELCYMLYMFMVCKCLGIRCSYVTVLTR